MSVSVPVLTGSDMSNFEPLVTQLREAGGIRMFRNKKEMVTMVRELLDNSERSNKQTEAAHKVLETHQGATRRTVEILAN
jgi:3-deoxy-D-manno-octulosonic-acid transferase